MDFSSVDLVSENIHWKGVVLDRPSCLYGVSIWFDVDLMHYYYSALKSSLEFLMALAICSCKDFFPYIAIYFVYYNATVMFENYFTAIIAHYDNIK